MKEHWQAEHPQKFASIKEWLGDSQAKIRTFELLAREGMLAPRNGKEPQARPNGDTE